MRRVRFRGEEYIMPPTPIEAGGFLATVEQFRHGECSFAHVLPSGAIMRFNEKIGDAAEIEDLGEIDVEIAEDAWDNLRGETWP